MRIAPVLAAVLWLVPSLATAESVDLIGTWYLLIHYKDDGTANPDEERWDDKVWVFEKKGSRMRWTEYPIVVFDDESGRFERRHTGQYARILHYWEPSAIQRADIADGLQVNDRGAKKKTLRGSNAKGWKSARPTQAGSASVITYSEVWTIEGMPTMPVFARGDFMSGATTDSMEGSTQYTTTEVVSPNEIVGTFERDETRHGTFRLVRSGTIGALKSDRSQSDRQREAFRRGIEMSPEVHRATREAVEARLTEEGITLTDEQIERVTRAGVKLVAQGAPQEQIDRQLAELISEVAAEDLGVEGR